MSNVLSSVLSRSFLAALLLGAAAPASAQTLTVWTFLNPNGSDAREVAFKALIERYETDHPGVTITVESQVWSELANKFVLSSNIGNAPDVVFVHGNSLRLIAESKSAADLDAGIVAKWSEEESADFLYQGLLDDARFGDRLVGIPLFPFATVLYYRKDLLEQAGYGAEDLATWSGFVEALRAVQQGRVSGVTIPLSPDRAVEGPLLTHLLEEQPALFDDACTLSVANDAGVRALEFQASLFTEQGIASREDLSRNLDDSWDLFLAGRAGAIFNASTRANQIQTSASWDASELGIAPMPGITADAAGPTVVRSWYVSVWEESGQKDLALDFVDFLVSTEGASQWALTGQQPPLRRSVLESPQLQDEAYALVGQIGSALASASVSLPVECRVDLLYSNLNQATQRVLVNNEDPLAALEWVEGVAAER
ncbi:extracellular solute-binding protein [Aquamicrobium sp. LC103]|uniref:ABC transporter substrate-binding protein n=1 Tax=Aquamicrobium sp. LC103 TaxID=1120658 RepID=UPI00063ED19E|nr:extracellular solute-binding protein [Aquamicrobium sp. LC103]TKT69252.1 extracellular solute-binding protein [Aquamicrobium sp. LC103]